MKSVQVTLMLTLDCCKMVNTNIPMTCNSCVPYSRSTSLIGILKSITMQECNLRPTIPFRNYADDMFIRIIVILLIELFYIEKTGIPMYCRI